MIYCSVIVINLIVQLGEEFDEKTADMRDVTTLAVFEGGKLVTLEKASPSLSLSLSLLTLSPLYGTWSQYDSILANKLVISFYKISIP